MRPLLFTAALLAVACSVRPVPEASPSPSDKTVTVKAFCTSTKTGPDESTVSTIDVWMYGNLAAFQSGNPAISHSRADGTSLTIEYDTGDEYLVVVANLPSHLIDVSDMFSPANLAFDIPGTLISLDDMSDEMVMSGAGDLSDAEDYGEVYIYVSRLVSKISVTKVTNRIEESPWAGKSVTLTGMYIINGVGRMPLRSTGAGYTPSVSDFFNCSCMYSPSVGPFPDFGQMEIQSLATASVGATIGYGDSFYPDVILYTGPNQTTSTVSTNLSDLMGATSWTTRRSRIVLQCSIDGKTCYYPILLPALYANRWYRYSEIILKHFGSDSPDTPVEFTQVWVAGETVGWDGEIISETI